MATADSIAAPDNWANLLWALSAADIARCAGLPWLPSQRRAALAAHFRRAGAARALAPLLDAHLHRLDREPRAARLGVYFEHLWAFAFAQHPHYELLYHNLPLRDGGRTLGELDFVVRHLPDGRIEHWEIAVKFYLQVNGSWVGPGLKDRLDIKLARMREHQLPLIEREAARQLLHRRDIRIERQWALMPGRLFRPLSGEAAPPAAFSPDACRHWWASLDAFQRHFGRQGHRWVRLPKRAWLADCNNWQGPTDSGDTLAERLRGEGIHGPLCIAALNAGGEVSRGFIVPDSWARNAQSASAAH